MKKHIQTFVLTAVLLCSVSIGSVISYAQCYSYTKSNLSSAISSVLRAANYSVRDTYTYGALYEGQTSTFAKTFYYGTNYALVAAGDDNAYDIDIYIYDRNWNLIDKDSNSSDVGVAEFRARYTGTYYVKVKMYDAYGRTRPCWVLRYGYY